MNDDSLDDTLASLRRVADPDGYRQARPRLLAAGPDRVSALCELLGDPDYDHGRVADLLGRIGDPGAVPALCELLLGADRWADASDAAIALGAIGDPAAVPALMRAAREGSGWVRENAVRALAEIAERNPHPVLERAVPLLTELASWGKWWESGRDAYRRAADRIAAALAAARDPSLPTSVDLPLPAAGRNSASELPLPAARCASADHLPMPSGPAPKALPTDA